MRRAVLAWLNSREKSDWHDQCAIMGKKGLLKMYLFRERQRLLLHNSEHELCTHFLSCHKVSFRSWRCHKALFHSTNTEAKWLFSWLFLRWEFAMKNRNALLLFDWVSGFATDKKRKIDRNANLNLLLTGKTLSWQCTAFSRLAGTSTVLHSPV